MAMAMATGLFTTGQFVIAQTSYCHRDGWYDEICKIIGSGEFPDTVTVQTETGKYYTINKNRITKIIYEKPEIKYQIGDVVEAVVDYHWHDGEDIRFCKVIHHTAFGDKLTYTLTLASDSGKVYTVASHNIKKKVDIKVPKFQVGDKVSYNKSIGHPFYHDYETLNGTIITVHPWYDHVKYIVTFENGTTESIDEASIRSYVPPAPKKDPYKDLSFLQQERERLLAQLQFIDGKIKNF